QQQAQYGAGEKVTVGMVGWYKLPYQDCVKNGDCMPKDLVIQGLITDPTDKKNPLGQWAEQRIELSEEVIYLQLWKEPLAWYWNLLMFMGGLGIAILVESRRKR
ncbi:MAG: hypothetical protein AAF828_13315, partial [Bacteroidota bacterium]